ncbi:hypothetical protein DYH09_08590 [bacterium CPR1]|nr:hypothetical protein [bacterium CPR1]
MNLISALPLRASGLFEGSVKNPEVEKAESDLKAARGQLETFQRRLDDTNYWISSSRRHRTHHCNSQVRDAMWNKSVKLHSGIAAHLCIFSMAGLGAWAMFSGMNPIVGLAGGVGLTYGYIMAMKHVVLPMQIDKAVLPALKQEKQGLEAAVTASRQNVQAAEAALVQGISGSLKGNPTVVQVDEAAVTLGGVRIKVRK